MPMEGVVRVEVTVVAGDVEEVDIPEDSLVDTADSLVDIPEDSLETADSLVVEDSLVAIEDLVVADLANIRRSAALGAIAEEDMEAVTVGDTAEVMLRDITMEDTTMAEDTMEGTTGTIIEDMPHMEQPLGFFSAG
jgi:hypothetical protein